MKSPYYSARGKKGLNSASEGQGKSTIKANRTLPSKKKERRRKRLKKVLGNVHFNWGAKFHMKKNLSQTGKGDIQEL